MPILTRVPFRTIAAPIVGRQSHADALSEIIGGLRQVGRWLSRPSNRLESTWLPEIEAAPRRALARATSTPAGAHHRS